MLLAIDVGNTETVIGLYTRDDGDVPAPEESVGVGIGTEHDPTAPRGLTHHWRLSTVPARTPDEHAVLLTQLLDLEGLDIATLGHGHRRQLLGAARDGRAAPDGDPLVLRRAVRRARTRHQERDADPLRQPQGGRRRPHRRRRRAPTTSTAGPASWSTWAPRRRSRRSAPRASTSAAPSRPAWPSASMRSTSRPPRCAGSSWSSRAASSGGPRWSRSSRGRSTGSPAWSTRWPGASWRSSAPPPWWPPAGSVRSSPRIRTRLSTWSPG